MISGFRDSDTEGHYVVITAADSLADFEALLEPLDAGGARQVELMELLTNRRVTGLAHAYIFEAEDVEVVDQFITAQGIVAKARLIAVDDQRRMVANAEPEVVDNRTLREIIGLTEENDRWDRRTEEEKAAANAMGKAAKKEGNLSGDSFSAKGKGDVRVTNVSAEEQEDGSFKITGAKAVKIERKPVDPILGAPELAAPAIPSWSPDNEGGQVLAANGEPILFQVGISEPMMPGQTAKDIWVCFATREYLRANDGAIPDFHLDDELRSGRGLPEYLDEGAENQFVVFPAGLKTCGEVVADLEALGYVEEPQMLEGMDDDGDEDHDCDHGPEAPPAPQFDRIIFQFGGDWTTSYVRLLEALGAKPDQFEYGSGFIAIKDGALANRFGLTLTARDETFKSFLALPFEPRPKLEFQIERGIFSMFFRVDFTDISIETVVETLLEKHGVNPDTLIQRGETADGAYIVCTVMRMAEQNAEWVKASHPGVTYRAYAIARDGERMAPDGIAVIDTNADAEYGPRPWDEDPSAWNALTDEEKIAEIKASKAEEFFYTGNYAPRQGTLVVFTPRFYFEREKEPWDGDLSEWLDPKLKGMEKEPNNLNGYRDKTLTYDFVTSRLGKVGFRESLMFRLWITTNG